MLHDLYVYFFLGGFTFLARHGHPEAKECQRADVPSVRPLSYVSWFINPKHPIITTAGWWYTYPSEKKRVRQLGHIFPIYEILL